MPLKPYLSLLLACTLFCLSCADRQAETSFLADIYALEDDPRAALSQLDTTGLHALHTLDQATRYLKKSLAQHYLQPALWPDEPRIMQAAALFRAHRAYEPLMETLCLASRMYEHRKEKDKQVALLREAIDLSQKAGDGDWLFFLYDHLSQMYLRQYDIVKYHRYQQAAHHCLGNGPASSHNLKTKVLIGKNYLQVGKTKEAISLLESVESAIGPTHICYADCRQYLSQAYLREGEWEKSIRKLNEWSAHAKDTDTHTLCNMLLAEAYYRKGDKAGAATCRQRIDTAQLSPRHYRIQKKYYELCARMAYEEKAYAEAARYERKLYQMDEEIIRKLNTKTLDEVILHDEMRKDRKAKAAYETRLHLLIGLMSLGLGGLLAIYLAKRKKYRQRKWELAQQIEVLQKLNDTQAGLKDELKNFIFRDFEIAKKIALLQQLDSDNDRRFLSKLHKLFLADTNTLLSLDWPAFYQHVDIYKQDFHARLTAAYPFLSEKEIQLSCLLMVGFNTAEIAAIWSQSVYSVHKYKTGIRKKTGMAEGADLAAEFSRRLRLQG